MARSFRSTKAVIVAAFFFPCLVHAASLDSYINNRTGLRHFTDKLYFQSYQDFLKALATEPLNPDLQMNLGMTFVANEEWEKAVNAFLAAYDMSKGDKTREFMALFNLAFAHWQKGDIDSALRDYQKALEIESESLEVKTDIELMWQSQQGKGEGKGQGGGQGQDKDKKDPNDKGDKDKNQDKQYSNQKQQPKPFDSKDLSKEDVRKILEEIGNQEQSIRAKEYDKGAKERAYDKDW